MPRIPTRQVEEKATTELLRVPVDANAFGANIGKATQGLGDAIGGVGNQFAALATEQKSTLDDQQRKAAVASFDYTPVDLARKQNAPADGSGVYDATKNDYPAAVEKHLDAQGITDPKVRQSTKEALMARQPERLASAAQFETTQKIGYSKTKADDALNAVENRVRANPAEFDQALKDSHALIDSRTEIPAGQREAMKTAQTQALSKRSFESRITNATSPEELDLIAKEMTATDQWQKRMSPQDFDRILDGARSAKSSLNTKIDTEARAALDSAKDRNNRREVLDPAELASIEATAKRSKNPGVLWGLAELREQQAIYRQYQNLSPEQLRQKTEEARGRQSANLPPEVANAVNEATGKTGISATYLAGMFNKEYGAGLYAAQGAGSGNLEGTSSAIGIAQFVKGTAAQIARGGDGFNARLMGIDIAGKSDEQIHAMFKDPKVAMIGAALLARQNGNQIQRAIGRPPSDGELYMAHFLGAGGAVSMLKAVASDPNQSAAKLLPEAAAANRSIFYTGGSEGGREKTVAEVYGRVTAGYLGGPSRIGQVRIDATQGLYDAQQKGLKDDFIKEAGKTFTFGPLSGADSFAARGRAYTAAADYFGIARSDAQPLSKGEAEQMTQQIKNGSADDVLNVLQNVQAMGGDAARAAAKQLGQTDSAFGFAAGLAADRGARDVAGDIIRGQKRIDADKDVKQAIGDDKVVTQTFESLTGKSLMGVAPETRQSIKDAALAHYVETHVNRSAGKFGAFDKNAYTASLNAVLTGNKAGTAVDSVNGEATVVPPGVTGKEFDRALDSFTIDTYVEMSKDGKPPRYADGTVARAEDIAVEGKFRSLGGGEYAIEMGNGKFLLSEIRADRTAAPYRFVADPDKIKKAAAAPVINQPIPVPAPAPGVEAPAIMRPGGALTNFDPATGRWTGPTR